jgi:hypothetical protein
MLVNRSLPAALFACVMAAAMAAQGAKTCMIVGAVFDSSRTPLSGPQLGVASDSGQSRAMNTDADGRFQFSDLPTGTYTLTVSYPNYQTFKREGINLPPGMNITQTVHLRPQQ